MDHRQNINPLENPSLDSALGGLRRGEDSRVYHPDRAIIIRDSGEFIKPVQDAKEQKRRANARLWERIGPLRYGDILFRFRSEVWHEEREEWWTAEEVDIYSDGEPAITFRVKVSHPVQQVTLRGSEIADRVANGTLISKAAVNEDLEQQLEELSTAVEESP